MNKTKKNIIIIVTVILAIIITLVSIISIMTYVGKRQFHKDDTHISAELVDVEDEETVSYNGKEYVLNKNIVSVLFMGVDRDNIDENLGLGNNGQADCIFVAAVDTKTKKVAIIPISRETMVDVNIYTTDGAFAGVNRQQLCLSYAYGGTPEASSENVMTSVRRILYGINISSYVTIEMDGIGKLTELIGGVDVECLEEIHYGEYQYYKGQNLNLSGEEARFYITYRDDDLEANARRMARQKQFLSALSSTTGNRVLEDFTRLSNYYTTLSPYFSTNVSLYQVTYLASSCLRPNFGDSLEFKTIEGTLTQGEKWVEFTPDEESALSVVMDTFYVEKEN